MRALLVVSLVVAAALAGCAGDGDGDAPGATPTPTPTATPPPPNEPPELALRVLDDAGLETNTTMVGGDLTFDATGSTDPDGRLVGLAVVVEDRTNTTRHAVLVEEGVAAMAAATFRFDRPGPVDVTLNGVDDRGAVANLRIQVFVNDPQRPDAFRFNLPATALGAATDCRSPTELPSAANVLESQGWRGFTFTVHPDATYIVARVAQGQAQIALCAPDGTAVSGAADETGFVVSNEDADLSAPTGIESFYVSALSGAPYQEVAVEVVVHYEPRPATVEFG